MDPPEVVVSEVERDGRFQVLDLPTECVRQSGTVTSSCPLGHGISGPWTVGKDEEVYVLPEDDVGRVGH